MMRHVRMRDMFNHGADETCQVCKISLNPS